MDEIIFDECNDVANINKEKICECFYDLYIQPRYIYECEDRKETAWGLEHFLKTVGMSFDEFYKTIWEYSLGCGLDYMNELNNDFIKYHDINRPTQKENDFTF